MMKMIKKPVVIILVLFFVLVLANPDNENLQVAGSTMLKITFFLSVFLFIIKYYTTPVSVENHLRGGYAHAAELLYTTKGDPYHGDMRQGVIESIDEVNGTVTLISIDREGSAYICMFDSMKVIKHEDLDPDIQKGVNRIWRTI